MNARTAIIELFKGESRGESRMKRLLPFVERWDVHTLDLLHYSSNGEREDRRPEEVLEMFKSLGALSMRGVHPPQSPP
jgi:hypothetical protein